MTSGKLSVEKRTGMMALDTLVLFFALPVWAVMYLVNSRNEVLEGSLTPVRRAAGFATGVVGTGNIAVISLVVIFAAVNGIISFMWLFRRSESDLRHSLPVKRENLFFASYLGGLLCFVLPYLLMLLVTCGIGSAYGVLNAEGLAVSAGTAAANILGYVLVYTTAVIAAVLTGQIAVSALGTAVLTLYSVMFTLILELCGGSFFRSWFTPDGISWGFMPLETYARLINSAGTAGSNTGDPGEMAAAFLYALVLAVILTGAALFLFRKRPSEAAGRAMAFPVSEPVIMTAVSFLAAVLFGLFFYHISGKITGWLIFGAAAGLLITHVTMEIIYRFDFRSAFSKLPQVLIPGVLAAIFIAFYMLDLSGYDRYVPGTDSVESAAVSFMGMGGESYINPDTGEYISREDYRFSHMFLTAPETLEAVNRMAERGAALYSEKNEEDQESRYAAVFCWRLKNGRTIYRVYPVKLNENSEDYSRIYGDSSYKEGFYQILSEETRMNGDLIFETPMGRLNTAFTEEEKEAFLTIYRKELLQRESTPDSSVPVMMFCLTDTPDLNPDGRYGEERYQSYIYPEFRETLAFLKERGVEPETVTDPEEVSAVQIYFDEFNRTLPEYVPAVLYSELAEESPEWKPAENSLEVTDPRQVREILSHSVPMAYTGLDPMEKERDPDYSVYVVFREGKEEKYLKTSFTQEIYEAFYRGEVPDFIKEKEAELRAKAEEVTARAD